MSRSNKTVSLRFLGVLHLGKLLMAALLLSGLAPAKTAAVSASDWQAGRIIDDSVFFNPNSMHAGEIQNFLNSKVPTCTGPSPPCLKSYEQDIQSVAANAYCSAISGGHYSAATIIKMATAACGISPQVMLVLLQKEQSLITSTAPSDSSYRSATGYGCPDTAACDAEFYGFFNQVYNAAKQFQRYAKNPNDYNFAVGRTSNVQYNPNSACGSSPITMQTQATAGLYNYTPYQPNQTALNAGYGTGDGCSAYGNRNFWRFFWDWFGNPIGPDYAWLIDSFSFGGGDDLLATGQPETLTLKARNVSRHPWYNHGDHPIRLGTWEPGRASPLLGGGTRYATLSENVVNPNEVGTFTFQITPNQEGTFVEAMNLVVENYTWMPWPGLSPTIRVSSGHQWQVQSVIYGNGTGNMEPNSTQAMTVIAKNTGNTTWSKTGNGPVWLATWEPGRVSQTSVNANGKWPNTTRVTQMNEASVAPGATAGFQFDVRVPYSGYFYERLNLVSEGQSWFNDTGLTLYLHGKDFKWQQVWQSLSTGNPNIGPGVTFDVTIKVRNTGETTWTKSGNFPVRLATAWPQNRGSAFFYPTWLRDTRPAALIEDSVPPGVEGTFTFTARAPTARGAWYEYFNLVAEGQSWASDNGFYFYVNVP